MTQLSDPLEEKRKAFERKRMLRRLLRQKEEPKVVTRRSPKGLGALSKAEKESRAHKAGRSKPTRKERQPNFGDPAGRIVAPIVGTIQKGMIPFQKVYTPELWARLRASEVERMAMKAAINLHNAVEEATKQKEAKDGIGHDTDKGTDTASGVDGGTAAAPDSSSGGGKPEADDSSAVHKDGGGAK